MQIEKQELTEIIQTVVNATIDNLEKRGVFGNVSANPKMKKEKTPYQKTEQLLYSYNALKKVIAERMQDIEDIKKYGVPSRCGGVQEYVNKGGLPKGIVLPEESVEAAIANVQASVKDTVQAIALIDKCMASLKNDPYYNILEMRYIEGRTQEDIALEFNCSQQTISNNKNRLVRELSIRMFPDQVVNMLLN